MSEAREEILLIDHASLLHPLWHVSANDPDPDAASIKTIARVHALSSGRAKVAICGESTKGSFRRELDPAYKATRGEKNQALYHQVDVSLERLAADGFPIWRGVGYEADDIVATAARIAVERGLDVLIASADKDLLALIGPHVRVLNTATGATIDEAGVVEKFGIKAEQMTDFLCLVGDASDNVKGADKIGPKTAAILLKRFGTLDELYAQLDEKGLVALQLTPTVAASLLEFRDRLELTRKLIGLRYDVEIPFDDVFKERVAKDAESFGESLMDDGGGEQMADESTEPSFVDLIEPPGAAPQTDTTSPAKTEEHTQPDGRVVQTQVVSAPKTVPANGLLDDVIAATPADWVRQLDPRSYDQARKISVDLFQSKMFSGYGSPQAVLSTIMMGRSLGLDAMASLRGIFNVESRHTLSAQLMVAIILKSGMAEYFRPTEISDRLATYETLRKGDGQKPFSLTHTIEMAQAAGLVKPRSNWEKSPTDMLCARASSRLARLIYSDLLFGLYTPEEIRESHEA